MSALHLLVKPSLQVTEPNSFTVIFTVGWNWNGLLYVEAIAFALLIQVFIQYMLYITSDCIISLQFA